MSKQEMNVKEPLLRMVKRDAVSNKEAWTIRGIAFVLSLITGGLLILLLENNPLEVYKSMVIGAWGSKTVIRETIKLSVPLLITAIGISIINWCCKFLSIKYDNNIAF